ncbi:MAG: hypothetical protein ABT20_09170 [Rubrivivax sp. SCN 70-15]|nr:MAG: hypothetical protein ABT20_09170 [Rubrivivax sp. SCN 70-15]
MMGGGWGGSAMFGASNMFLWLLLIVGVVVLAIWLARGPRSDANDRDGRDRALAILKERYARGEIDKAEFDTRKRDLA